MLGMSQLYARALYEDTGATLDNLREAVRTNEEVEQTARRVLGGAHPMMVDIERSLRFALEALSIHPHAAAAKTIV